MFETQGGGDNAHSNLNNSTKGGDTAQNFCTKCGDTAHNFCTKGWDTAHNFQSKGGDTAHNFQTLAVGWVGGGIGS